MPTTPLPNKSTRSSPDPSTDPSSTTPGITRRTLLTAGSAVGALGAGGAALTTPGHAASTSTVASVRLTRQERRVVVVGSGFGGGVTALRLTQAGVPVTMLERGKRWGTGPNADTFARVSSLDNRALWHESAPSVFGQPLIAPPHTGLLETVVGENMTVINAAGLGGGSLAYQGMSLQPSAEVFAHEFPEALDYSWMNRVHFRRVEQMLGLATAPDALVNHKNYKVARVFAQKAKAAGYSVDKIPMPIDWSYAMRELTGEFKATYTNGDCSFGVNNGGKNTVDVTYIKAAEATGLLEVRTLSNVRNVFRTRSGTWEVHVDHTDTSGKVLEQFIITTPTLVMGAGSTGTSRLLVRAKALGHITDLPDELGTNWGSNADQIYTWTSLFDNFGPVQGGPVVYGSKQWSNPATANTVIQASMPPIMAGINSNSPSFGPAPPSWSATASAAPAASSSTTPRRTTPSCAGPGTGTARPRTGSTPGSRRSRDWARCSSTPPRSCRTPGTRSVGRPWAPSATSRVASRASRGSTCWTARCCRAPPRPATRR